MRQLAIMFLGAIIGLLAMRVFGRLAGLTFLLGIGTGIILSALFNWT